MRFGRFGAAFMGLLAFLFFYSQASASGQIGVAAATVEKPVTLTEFEALGIHNRGPAEAFGVIYFIDGLDPAERAPDDFKPTYPYLGALNDKFGWDVVNAKYPNSEKDITTSVPRAVAYVKGRVEALKAKGYKRVVLAGQSWGGWVSINVADLKDAAATLDGLLLVAPAAYGSKVWKGADNPYYLQNLTEYIRHIKSVRTPTVAVFFNGDDFDPGQRGDVTDAFLARNATPLLLIDRPEGLAGHGAGWLPPFADRYAGCIGNFLQAPKTTRCGEQTPPVAAASNLTEKDVKADKAFAPADQKEIAGIEFIMTTPDINVQVLRFGDSKVEIAAADGDFESPATSSANQACIDDECYRLYRASKDRYLGFHEDVSFAGWLTPVAH
jgi:pimeloyl-ACP methyl ester carboxylesterase